MNDFLKDIINETFKSKKQQRYFYAKAGDKSLPKKERNKWKKWSKEFSDKTDFEKLPEVAEEQSDFSFGEMKKKETPTMIKLINTAIKDGFIDKNESSAMYIMSAAKKIAEKWDELNPDEQKVNRDTYYKLFLKNIGKLKKNTELDEVVDELGNIARSKIPTDAATKGITQKKTTDQVVKTGAGSMGIHGVHGTHTSLRYWAESDMSKTLGFDATLKQDASRKEAEKYFKKDLGLDEPEAEERLDAMGYDPELPDDKVRLVENPKKFIEEYIESLLTKKTSNNELVSKEKDLTEINPIVLKQIKSLKQSLESNEISIQDLIKLLKDNE